MKKITLTRTFSAPIEKVWDAFTHADILKQWWFPPTMTCSHASLDLTEGGIFRYCFLTEDGKEFWGRGVYKSIEKPTLLSYLNTFTDAAGVPVPPSHFGIPGDDVVETLVEFHFDSQNGKTTVELIGENFYDESMTDDMMQGWNGMFDNLEIFVKK
jgi:uncharacterized protein YndB with AHSA1/START domain